MQLHLPWVRGRSGRSGPPVRSVREKSVSQIKKIQRSLLQSIMSKKQSLGKKGLPEEGKLVEEGTAKVYFQGDVFYNPVQVFNRDLSIHVIKAFDVLRRAEYESGKLKGKRATQRSKAPRNLKILEALSATGLRSIRYVKEIPNVGLCVANDISKEAAEAIHRNAVSNECDTNILQASHNDAVLLMHQHKTTNKQFDVVDLDPYGAPMIFLDSAVQSVAEGGLMCVTSTDMPVLSGVYPAACYAKYGSMPIKTKYCHEMALRMLLNCISTHASRYGRYIHPLLSVSTDFYIRVFVRVFSGKLQVKLNPTKTSYVHQCMNNIPSFVLHPVAVNKRPERTTSPHIVAASARVPNEEKDGFYGRNYHVGGPIWNQPIHDKDFVSMLLKSMGGPECPEKALTPGAPVGRRWKKMHGVLTLINEESECFDCPLYYHLPDLSNTLRCITVPLFEMLSALKNAGYRASQTHAKINSVKTDAPNEVIWDIMRAWVKLNPISEKRKIPGTALIDILARKSKIEVDFTMHKSLEDKKKSRATGFFLPNPEKFWGPKSRAKKQKKKKHHDENTEDGTTSASSSKRRKVEDELSSKMEEEEEEK